MNETQTPAQPSRPWARTAPRRTAPDRGPGGYYRAAAGESGTGAYYGVPLRTAEETAVSAVRAAYRVADAQMERGARIARSLREASVRQGAGEPAETLDAGERLARKALLAGVEWLETLAAQPGSPVKRVLAAEYRWIGAALGIVPGDGAGAAAPSKPAPSPAAQSDVQEPPVRHAARPMGPTVKIRHKEGSAFRAVSIVRWDVSPAFVKASETKLRFFGETNPSANEIEGTLCMEDDGPVMTLTTLTSHAPGRWKSALCTADGTQFGIVEIEL
ncbi:hypothetical protein [Variovorax sp. YR216]|uniref:hypothetical protein n=1 Tax=Variovorax sp. YR216 TaxID=1882828 RepID=UPI00089C25A7|nr:hypothetical protein [Variovorax sp. YR216]SEB16061.1 hypothetical protein SAMN05444680_110118 [Variovorax sp. YR216]